MRLADIKGDKAFEVLADLLEPITVLGQDDEIKEAGEESILRAIQVILRKHPREVKQMIAIMDLQDPETYEITGAVLTRKGIELFSDPDIVDLFFSQAQEDMIPSGSVTANTEESAK